MTTSAVRPATRRSRRSATKKKSRPPLRFTPEAWAKLHVLRDLGPTEVGGFGITAADDPLLVEDVRLVEQSADPTSVLLDDAAVADYFDECVDEGIPLESCGRVWIHTHPADSARPSWTDEETFERVFGHCHWAVMAILARGGQRYARLRFGVGPGGQLRVPMRIDWSAPFDASDHAAWEREYEACVTPLAEHPSGPAAPFEDWPESFLELAHDFHHDDEEIAS